MRKSTKVLRSSTARLIVTPLASKIDTKSEKAINTYDICKEERTLGRRLDIQHALLELIKIAMGGQKVAIHNKQIDERVGCLTKKMRRT